MFRRKGSAFKQARPNFMVQCYSQNILLVDSQNRLYIQVIHIIIQFSREVQKVKENIYLTRGRMIKVTASDDVLPHQLFRSKQAETT